MSLAQAIFAAGCFWGVQAVFDSTPGVTSTEVGYIGGTTADPTYQQVCTDQTGHAEAVRVTYNPAQISYETLLDVFFSLHDPTTLNRQGADIGTQYRSAVFYQTPEQQAAALQKITALEQARIYKNPIVTEVVPAAKFYPAEEYHQKYFAKQGQAHNCGLQRPQIYFSDAEWKQRLSSEQYRILRQKGTEAPFSGQYLKVSADGTFVCAACGNPIFATVDKFESGCGWPSFDKALPDSVRLQPDFSHGMTRTEVVCGRCGSHLGHLFADGPTATGMRFCINSAALNFKKSNVPGD